MPPRPGDCYRRSALRLGLQMVAMPDQLTAEHYGVPLIHDRIARVPLPEAAVFLECLDGAFRTSVVDPLGWPSPYTSATFPGPGIHAVWPGRRLSVRRGPIRPDTSRAGPRHEPPGRTSRKCRGKLPRYERSRSSLDSPQAPPGFPGLWSIYFDIRSTRGDVRNSSGVPESSADVRRNRA